MDFSKIVCIEIRKYNQDQLTKIAESLGFEANPSDENFFNLFTCKKSKVEKVYIIPGEAGPFALKYKKEVGVDSPEQLYKDTLFIFPAYRGLSKKEKDRLMKLESFDFFKKKSKSVDSTDSKPMEEQTPIFDLDLLLDKISQFGINSLLKEEKDFLDNLSKE